MRVESVPFSTPLHSRFLAALLLLASLFLLEVRCFSQDVNNGLVLSCRNSHIGWLRWGRPGSTTPATTITANLCNLALVYRAGITSALVNRTEITQGSASLGTLPASFIGDLPCADCPGIRYQVNLFPDQVFFSQMIYQERPGTFDEMGTWETSAGGKILRLRSSQAQVVNFSIGEMGTLRRLDSEEHPIESSLKYELHRSEKLVSIEPGLKLRGMYRYMADAGIFRECSTGKSWPVAQERENATLETAYLEARRVPGEELLVTVIGQLASRPRMEGKGTQLALIVEQFLKLHPGETCGGPFATVSLGIAIALNIGTPRDNR